YEAVISWFMAPTMLLSILCNVLEGLAEDLVARQYLQNFPRKSSIPSKKNPAILFIILQKSILKARNFWIQRKYNPEHTPRKSHIDCGFFICQEFKNLLFTF